MGWGRSGSHRGGDTLVDLDARRRWAGEHHRRRSPVAARLAGGVHRISNLGFGSLAVSPVIPRHASLDLIDSAYLISRNPFVGALDIGLRPQSYLFEHACQQDG